MLGKGGWVGIQVNGENSKKFEVTWWVGNDPSCGAEVGRRRRRQLRWEDCVERDVGKVWEEGRGNGENWERI